MDLFQLFTLWAGDCFLGYIQMGDRMSKVLGDLLIHFRTYGQAFGHGSGRRVCSAEITSTALS